ncbi:MAG: P-loop ATPase, Sll1717 family [Alphaproteobacteria bacterium]
MDHLALLKQLSFGAQVAEEETNELASYFVETHQWTRMAKGDIDIIRGEKGSGKSAIYSLLMTKADEFFDKGILLVPAENPRGATVFRDLVADPPTSEVEFIVLWKLYIITIIAQKIREFDIRNAQAQKVYLALESAQLLEREFTLGSVLRRVQDYTRRIMKAEALEGGITVDPLTGMPSGVVGRIVLKEPTSDLKARGLVSVDSLFATLNDALAPDKLRIWILLDRLDVAFTDNHLLEANALRALIRVYGDIRHADRVSLKIFIREDIWKRITEGGFREASHVIKVEFLEWTAPTLLNLIMRRVLNNKVLAEELRVDTAGILQHFQKQEELFDRLFPKQVEQGPQKAPTFKWMVMKWTPNLGPVG